MLYFNNFNLLNIMNEKTIGFKPNLQEFHIMTNYGLLSEHAANREAAINKIKEGRPYLRVVNSVPEDYPVFFVNGEI